MGWIVLIVILTIIAACLESLPGKMIAGSAIVAIGCLLLRWITGVALFIIFAKACAIIIVITIVGIILSALMG